MTTRCALTCSLVLSLVCTVVAAEAPKAGPRFEKRKLADNLIEACAIADVNNDGKPDIIAGSEWYEGPDWEPHPIREVIRTGPQNEFKDTNGNHAYDVNGDGWTDVIAASWFSDKTFWYENPGKDGLADGRKWKGHQISSGYPECEGTVLSDLDGDKAPEILINCWSDARPLAVVKMTPGKKGSEPSFKTFEIGPHSGHGIGVGDINGDGRADVVTVGGWYEAPAGDRFASKWKFHKAAHLSHFSLPCLVQDLNGDGKNDLIIGQAHDYGLFWLEQGPVKDGEITWTRHEIDKSFSQVHCLAWADVDGDGQPEVVTGKRWRPHCDGDPGAAEPVCLFRFTWDKAAKSFTKLPISYNDGVGTGMQICVADLNADKRPDIAVAGKTGIYVLYNRPQK